MTQNLDELRKDIERELRSRDIVIFYGSMRPPGDMVQWDSPKHPDYQEFINAAQQTGTKLMVVYDQQFEAAEIEDLLQDLEMADLRAEDEREYRRRLKKLRDYDGFTCVIELSFDHSGQTYMYHLHTDWFAEYLAIHEEIESSLPDGDDEDEDDDDSMGGYFSRN
jgi:hypothetical protein